MRRPGAGKWMFEVLRARPKLSEMEGSQMLSQAAILEAPLDVQIFVLETSGRCAVYLPSEQLGGAREGAALFLEGEQK